MTTAQSAASERAAFIRRVYDDLAGAVLALIAVEFLLLQAVRGNELQLVRMMVGGWSWLVVMLLFMGGLVAMIVSALILPIFKLSAAVH